MVEPLANKFELPVADRRPASVPDVVEILRANLKAVDAKFLTTAQDCAELEYTVFAWRRRRETILAVIAALS